MFTISVHYQGSGSPVTSKKVFISFANTWLEEYTNSSGEAHFNTYPQYGEVIVDGSTRHKGCLSGKVVVYI